MFMGCVCKIFAFVRAQVHQPIQKAMLTPGFFRICKVATNFDDVCSSKIRRDGWLNLTIRFLKYLQLRTLIICAAWSTWPAIQVIVTLRCVAPGAIISCATDTQEEHANRQKSRLQVNRKSRPQEPKRQQPTSSWNDQNILKWNSTSGQLTRGLWRNSKFWLVQRGL